MINNYEIKQRVLQLGIDRHEKILHKNIYKCGLAYFETGNIVDYDNSISMYQDAAKEYGDDWVIAKNLNKSRYNRIERISKKTWSYIQTGKAVFLTLTMTDKTLNSANEQTLRKYAARFLKSQCDFFLANEDHGQDEKYTERLHFHAIVVPKNDKVSLKEWRKYGQINAKRIRTSELDKLRTAKYLAKLTYHAIKNNGMLKRLLYSRNMLK